MIDPGIFDRDRLVATVLEHSPDFRPDWRYTDCEILPQYVPPFAKADFRPICVVRHVPSGSFLRYSKGPRQGHFWDLYGEDYLTPELALIALCNAPMPPRWQKRKDGQ